MKNNATGIGAPRRELADGLRLDEIKPRRATFQLNTTTETFKRLEAWCLRQHVPPEIKTAVQIAVDEFLDRHDAAET